MSFQNYLASSRNSVAKYNASGRTVGVANPSAFAGVSARGHRNMAGVGNAMAATGTPDYSNVAPLFGIQVANTTTANLTNVDILGSFQYTPQSSLFTNGNYVSGGVTISTIFSTINYQQFLTSTATQQFKVGAIHVLVTAGASANAQAFDVLTVTTQSQSGATQSIPVKQLLSPNQYQSGVAQNYINFIVDGFTKITLANLYASTTVQYSFFPQLTQNPSGTLAGQGGTSAWGQAQLG